MELMVHRIGRGRSLGTLSVHQPPHLVHLGWMHQSVTHGRAAATAASVDMGQAGRHCDWQSCLP